jgi:hypothetical protein
MVERRKDGRRGTQPGAARKYPPGEAMTLGHMRSLGVRRLSVSCLKCHHPAVIDVDRYPDDVPVPSFGPRMVCSACGQRGAFVMPHWNDQPSRPKRRA